MAEITVADIYEMFADMRQEWREEMRAFGVAIASNLDDKEKRLRDVEESVIVLRVQVQAKRASVAAYSSVAVSLVTAAGVIVATVLGGS